MQIGPLVVGGAAIPEKPKLFMQTYDCYPGVPTYVYEKKVGGSGGNGRKYVSSITKETLFDLVNEAFDGDQVINQFN